MKIQNDDFSVVDYDKFSDRKCQNKWNITISNEITLDFNICSFSHIMNIHISIHYQSTNAGKLKTSFDRDDQFNN